MVKRDQDVHFLASKEEVERIHQKMDELGIRSMGAYLRKMALDGYCINLDLQDVKAISRRSPTGSVRNGRFSRKSEPSVTSFVKLSTRYSKRSPRVLKILFRLLLIWDSSIRMESSQRFGERNRSGLFVCVLLARDIVKKNSVPLSQGKACTSLRVVSGRLLNRSSFIFSLIFNLRWQREKRLGMNAGQRNTTVKKLPGQSAF